MGIFSKLFGRKRPKARRRAPSAWQRALAGAATGANPFAPQLLHTDSAGLATTSGMLPGGIAQGWMNPQSGLGVPGLDPTAQLVYYGGRLPSPMMLDKLYQFDWLAARVVEMFPRMALVRGVKGVEKEIWDKFVALDTTERHRAYGGAFFRAVCEGRAHGGAVLHLGYALGNPRSPLTPEHAQGGINFLDVYQQHELRVLRRYEDPNRADFGMPSLYEVVANGTAMPHPRTGQIFHASRAIRFAGLPLRTPNTALEVNDLTGTQSMPELGVSVLTPLLHVLGQYGLAWSAVSNMLQDASVGWMKMAGLVEALASEDKEIVEDRMKVMQQTKGTHRMLFLDADANEEYGRTEVSLTDIPNVLQQFTMLVAACANVPARVFFSTPPQGLNASSGNESDLTQLYNNTEDYQRRDLGPALNTVLTAINGGKPVEVEWPSLWQTSDNERAQTRTAQANADKIYWDMGYSAAQIGKARATGTVVELTGEEPEDNRDEVAGAGQPETPPGSPTGAPDKKGASKIATAQRAAGKK